MLNEERYAQMRLIRECEEAIRREYPSNEIKTPCHLAIGAEAIAVGTQEVFPDASVFASYRNHHWYLAKGGSLDDFWAELFGRQNPIADGKAGSMHLSCPKEGLILTSAVVASQISPALGHAFAMKQMGSPGLTIAALGDGAMEEGVFYECLNLSALWKLPLLLVVEDNDLAIHQSRVKRQAFSLAKLAAAYDIPYHQRMGVEIAEVVDTLKAITSFPAIAHFNYHRFMEHVGINEDYDAGYRERPRTAEFSDPMTFIAMKIDEKKKLEIDAQIRMKVDLSIEKAKNTSFAPKDSLLEHVFSP